MRDLEREAIYATESEIFYVGDSLRVWLIGSPDFEVKNLPHEISREELPKHAVLIPPSQWDEAIVASMHECDEYEATTFRCEACEQVKWMGAASWETDHNRGGDRICLDCHHEALGVTGERCHGCHA